MKVAIFCGSRSDKPTMKISEEILNKFNIKNQTYVISAHRLPDILSHTIREIESVKEVEVIIAGAGLSAHLPGIIASKTILPVIGVPILDKKNGLLGGMDALFSIVQMPKDVPVATVGINNAYNAALLSVHILAVKYKEIKESLLKFRKDKLFTKIEK
ncbi:MAG: 5-(carboxyamino)imidazole ribonucleotide mutase [Flavobacteriales bacterium]|jgi:5-(carboxyamino)imidazole ribonucleotide mutase|uniref:5-(carboxyamino)imidazole ribonucleotide mutase n=1 Tax=Blattabacterium sp. (Mastotermes darwiniensis) TaxID=39768 RepID=UPI000231DDD8|nr:5-(carboxyamino)imidazole ribonucleotide mutase [Blattabacterium sp. (Mastotermes darwiniensis)]AER40524.1 phosphoribosylaminoimidazole carboxylase catalytic subunit [Blattabacterium sp. (Mastotermes darwiniensis) str. MADAR]MDR1804962.1 5-(carboxyamino)imidazole ribonucleotide mutase [Flavobacteriales bacterium]